MTTDNTLADLMKHLEPEPLVPVRDDEKTRRLFACDVAWLAMAKVPILSPESVINRATNYARGVAMQDEVDQAYRTVTRAIASSQAAQECLTPELDLAFVCNRAAAAGVERAEIRELFRRHFCTEDGE